MSRRFYDTSAAEGIIKAIKRGEYPNKAAVIGLLKQIINDCRGTKVAEEVKELLDELD